MCRNFSAKSWKTVRRLWFTANLAIDLDRKQMVFNSFYSLVRIMRTGLCTQKTTTPLLFISYGSTILHFLCKPSKQMYIFPRKYLPFLISWDSRKFRLRLDWTDCKYLTRNLLKFRHRALYTRTFKLVYSTSIIRNRFSPRKRSQFAMEIPSRMLERRKKKLVPLFKINIFFKGV